MKCTENTHAIPFAVLSLFALVLSGALSISNCVFFQPYFGELHPLLVVPIVVAVGWVSLDWLHRREWFTVVSSNFRWGIATSAMLASLFGIVVIGVDLSVGFLQDINVPLPQSVLFYPVMAFVVEVIFHAFPLALLSILFKQRTPFELAHQREEASKSLSSDNLAANVFWFSIVFVALLEPAFHTSVALSSPSFSGLDVFVGFHVFVINLAQLIVFKRYGFVSMFALRLFYYLIWHVVWGQLRLGLVF